MKHNDTPKQWLPDDDGFTDYDDVAPFLERPHEPLWPWVAVLVVCVVLAYALVP